jgi:hypothetical protein
MFGGVHRADASSSGQSLNGCVDPWFRDKSKKLQTSLALSKPAPSPRPPLPSMKTWFVIGKNTTIGLAGGSKRQNFTI